MSGGGRLLLVSISISNNIIQCNVHIMKMLTNSLILFVILTADIG